LIKEGLSSVAPEMTKFQKEEIEGLAKYSHGKTVNKLRIKIACSRNVFGVCDPIGMLEYGQCFFRPIIAGRPQTLVGKIIVARNPCYFPGDIRILQAVQVILKFSNQLRLATGK
jgi:hypothetical protein